MQGSSHFLLSFVWICPVIHMAFSSEELNTGGSRERTSDTIPAQAQDIEEGRSQPAEPAARTGLGAGLCNNPSV